MKKYKVKYRVINYIKTIDHFASSSRGFTNASEVTWQLAFQILAASFKKDQIYSCFAEVTDE